MTLKDFESILKDYLHYRKVHLSDSQRHHSRVSKTRPFLVYKPIGTYGYVENYEAVCKYTNRSVELFLEFMATHIGCKVEKFGSKIRTHGIIKSNHFKSVENLFYTLEVLCQVCKSPETTRVNKEEVLCTQCGVKTANTIKKRFVLLKKTKSPTNSTKQRE